MWWRVRGGGGGVEEREKEWRMKGEKEGGGMRRPSLVRAMNEVVGRWFWVGGALRLVSDLAEVGSPLIVKVNTLLST